MKTDSLDLSDCPTVSLRLGWILALRSTMYVSQEQGKGIGVPPSLRGKKGEPMMMMVNDRIEIRRA